eukprot:m.347051 g.347051  ORF g.347051 m.347051 type:complete len:542 (-) comp31205_c0_seq1:171-1796(-)
MFGLLLASVVVANSPVYNVTNVTVKVDLSQKVGALVESDYIGVSSSYGDFLRLLGNQSKNYSGAPFFVEALQSLKTCSRCAGPRIRLNAGQGGAKVYWALQYPNSTTGPFCFGPVANFPVHPGNLKALHDAATALNGTITTGLDWVLLNHERFPPPDEFNTALQTGFVRGIASTVGFDRFREFEIANEPDLNSVRTGFFFNDPNSTAPPSDIFLQVWKKFAQDNYAAGLPPGSIQGGVLAGENIAQNETDIMAKTGNLITVWNRHVYPLLSHKDPTKTPSNGYGQTIENLFQLSSRDVAQIYERKLPSLVGNVSKAGYKFIIGESQSVNMGGAWNVSDVLATALWTLDFLSTAAKNGVHQVNFNFGQAASRVPYSYIGFNDVNYSTKIIKPQFLGFMAFNTATQSQNGESAQFLNTSIYPTAGNSSEPIGDRFALHTIQRGDGSIAMIAINFNLCNETATNTTVYVDIPPTYQKATLSRLSGYPECLPSAPAAKFAGFYFDHDVNTGKPLGTKETENIIPNSDGTFQFEVMPTSAAVIQFS